MPQPGYASTDISRDIAAFIARVAAVLVTLVFSFLPFLPGRYDSAAAPLFLLAQVVSFGSLLLLPVGAVWLGLGNRLTPAGHRGFALAALIVASVVWLVVALPLFAFGTMSLGGLAILLWIAVVARARAALRSGEAWSDGRGRAWALYLVTAPLVLAGAHAGFVGRAIDASRDRAMRNAEPLIAAIEGYRAANGRYPVSTLSVWPDYLPGVAGIERYHYEPHGESFNLIFEQVSNIFGTREFVVYNPRDEQVFTAHARVLLERSPGQLGAERARGHYAVYPASRPHWKLFRFD